jgi:hypothetical protein
MLAPSRWCRRPHPGHMNAQWHARPSRHITAAAAGRVRGAELACPAWLPQMIIAAQIEAADATQPAAGGSGQQEGAGGQQPQSLLGALVTTAMDNSAYERFCKRWVPRSCHAGRAAGAGTQPGTAPEGGRVSHSSLRQPHCPVVGAAEGVATPPRPGSGHVLASSQPALPPACPGYPAASSMLPSAT